MEVENKKKKKLIIVIAIIIAIVVALAAILAVTGSDASKIKKQLKAADAYLLEMNYDAAILAYEQVLSLDSKNVNAYLGLADAYMGKGELEKAKDVLSTAKEQVLAEDKALIEAKASEVEKKIEELKPKEEEKPENTVSEPAPIVASSDDGFWRLESTVDYHDLSALIYGMEIDPKPGFYKFGCDWQVDENAVYDVTMPGHVKYVYDDLGELVEIDNYYGYTVKQTYDTGYFLWTTYPSPYNPDASEYERLRQIAYDDKGDLLTDWVFSIYGDGSREEIYKFEKTDDQPGHKIYKVLEYDWTGSDVIGEVGYQHVLDSSDEMGHAEYRTNEAGDLLPYDRMEKSYTDVDGVKRLTQEVKGYDGYTSTVTYVLDYKGCTVEVLYELSDVSGNIYDKARVSFRDEFPESAKLGDTFDREGIVEFQSGDYAGLLLSFVEKYVFAAK